MALYSWSLLLMMDLFPPKSKRRLFSSYQILSVFLSCHFSMDYTAFSLCILNVCFLFSVQSRYSGKAKKPLGWVCFL